MNIKKIVAGVAFATICGVGGYTAVTLTESEPEATTTIATTDTATTTTEPTQEKITFEYYVITEEAVKNGWTCGTIDRCDKFSEIPIYVYIYDPALLGKHKINVTTGADVLQADINVVYVDIYNNILGEEAYTVYSNSLRGFVLVIEDYPVGTKYVKFADITNIVYPDREVSNDWECNQKECVNENGKMRVDISDINIDDRIIAYFYYDVVQFNLDLLFVNENGEITEKTLTVSDYNENLTFDWKYRKYYVFIDYLLGDDFPEDTKYIKFKDINNIIEKD